MARQQIQTSVKDDAAGNITEIDYHGYLDTLTNVVGGTYGQLLFKDGNSLGYKTITDDFLSENNTGVLSARMGRKLNQIKADNNFFDNQNVRYSIGKDVTDLQINANQKYAFTNCWGSVTYKPNNTFYISNSPNLTVSGKNSSNWENIWIDGVASSPDGSITKWQDGKMIICGNTGTPSVTAPYAVLTYAFPIAFKYDEPVYGTVSPTNNNDGAYWKYSVYIVSMSNTHLTVAMASTGGEIRNSNYIAIGRWK